jgi:hypothetical protein
MRLMGLPPAPPATVIAPDTSVESVPVIPADVMMPSPSSGDGMPPAGFGCNCY